VSTLDGYRIVVVGASSGIGREVGIQAVQAGASVAFAARRADLLESAVAVARGGEGPQSFAIPCDVRDDAQCARAVEEAVARFGGLDAVVYATGKSPLVRSNDADGDTWRELFETNVVGAAMVTRAALPHLKSTGGRMVFLGSSSVGRPYPGLVAYTTTKAALHELARGLRNEHPWLRLTTFVVGPTITEFANSWDTELFMEMHGRWSAEGYPAGNAMAVEDMAAQVIRVLASGARIDEVHVMPDNPDPATEGDATGTIGANTTPD
jgi:NAD(P)-dependent dehydrogenase (short-subunit alcohol dehydrogenase family)